MALVKGTLFFSAGGNGWSESWYREAASAAAVLADLDRLAVARATCLVHPYAIVGGRAVVDGYPPDGQPFATNTGGQFRLRTGVIPDAGPPYAGVLTRLDSAPIPPSGRVVRRSVITRGCPRDLFTGTVAFSLSATSAQFQSAVREFYSTFLKQNGWGMRRRILGEPVTITAVAPYGTRAWRITVDDATNFVARNRMLVSSATGTRGLNGQHVIDQIIGDDIITRPIKRQPLVAAGATFGQAWPLTFSVVQWVDVLNVRTAKKSTGRPFAVSAGRAAVRSD